MNVNLIFFLWSHDSSYLNDCSVSQFADDNQTEELWSGPAGKIAKTAFLCLCRSSSSFSFYFFKSCFLTFSFQVVPTTDHIDTEKLKAREQIKFFEEVLLFEDELHDHGVSSLSVKIVSKSALSPIVITGKEWNHFESYWI